MYPSIKGVPMNVITDIASVVGIDISTDSASEVVIRVKVSGSVFEFILFPFYV